MRGTRISVPSPSYTSALDNDWSAASELVTIAPLHCTRVKIGGAKCLCVDGSHIALSLSPSSRGEWYHEAGGSVLELQGLEMKRGRVPAPESLQLCRPPANRATPRMEKSTNTKLHIRSTLRMSSQEDDSAFSSICSDGILLMRRRGRSTRSTFTAPKAASADASIAPICSS